MFNKLSQDLIDSTYVILNPNNILTRHNLKMRRSKCCLHRAMAAEKEVKFKVIQSNVRKAMNEAREEILSIDLFT